MGLNNSLKIYKKIALGIVQFSVLETIEIVLCYEYDKKCKREEIFIEGGKVLAKELMSKEIIMFDVEAGTRDEVIEIIADAMYKDGRIINKEGYIADVMKRENGASTAVGFCIATPHAKSAAVKEVSLAYVRLKNNIEWDEEENVNTVFQIGVPSPGQGDRHLEILAGLFRKIIKTDFRNKLAAATTPEEIISMIGEI